jgi:hypothetical protein
MARGEDTRFDPSRTYTRDRAIAENDDVFRAQPGWAMWHGGSSYAQGDPYAEESYEYFANMGEAENAMRNRYYGRDAGTGYPAVGQDQSMTWHTGSKPWEAQDPYPDARIFQNEFKDPTSVTEEPTFGWERT